MTKETFIKFEKYIWWIFILLPLIIGLVRYNWLSVEPYYSNAHLANTANTLVSPAASGTIEAPAMRKLKGMDKASTKEDFIHERFVEVARYCALSFLYGLLGCVFYSYGQVIKGKSPTFSNAFGKSLIFALLFPVFFLVCTL
jgi:hypothetical protein